MVTKEELKYLTENADFLIAKKKSIFKTGCAIGGVFFPALDKNGFSVKSEAKEDNVIFDKRKQEETNGILKRHLVISVQNYYDSYMDVQIDGCFNKSIKENKFIYLADNHKKDFKDVISRDIKPYTTRLKWREIGYEADGDTEVLVFDANITKKQHEYMFEQYLEGNVTNHSVGMYYKDLKLCINNKEEWAKSYYDNWEKYFNFIVNKEDALKNGYFYAVLQAQVVEGSSVLRGAHPMTPTLGSIELKSEKVFEPSVDTRDKKPSIDTFCKRLIQII